MQGQTDACNIAQQVDVVCGLYSTGRIDAVHGRQAVPGRRPALVFIARVLRRRERRVTD